jgi:hypothetical protein
MMEPDVLRRPGIVNYVVTRLVASTLEPDEGWSYHSISRALAVLSDAKAEMRRRLMDVIENNAIVRNGDLQEYGSGSRAAIPETGRNADGH